MPGLAAPVKAKQNVIRRYSLCHVRRTGLL